MSFSSTPDPASPYPNPRPEIKLYAAQATPAPQSPEQSQIPIGVRPGRNPILAPLARYWWVELVLGAFWLVIAGVVLKFNHASAVTVGVLVGIMFLVFAAEVLALAALDKGATRWLWGFFGVLLLAAGIVSLIHPRETFAGFADILGFVFLLIGVVWTIQAFAERQFSDFWWMDLVAGILLIVLGFWTSAQFLLERAYTLLIFAGIWALVKRITDIVRRFSSAGSDRGDKPRAPWRPFCLQLVLSALRSVGQAAVTLRYPLAEFVDKSS